MPLRELEIHSLKKELERKGPRIIIGGPRPISDAESVKKKCMHFKKCKNKVYISYDTIELVKAGGKVICPECFFKLAKKEEVSVAVLEETVERVKRIIQGDRAS